MGRDFQPKERQLARKVIKADRRAQYARILIVSEGSKTEPRYFEEIRSAYQLHSANVVVQPGQLGTAPIQVVQYAKKLVESGDLYKGIRPGSFDQVYVVFDRDDHGSYHDALQAAQALDGKFRNDSNERISFKAIPSIPSFELWLLLHYEDIQTPIHRDEVMRRLRRHIQGYEKGTGGAFANTRDRLAIATQRARALATKSNAYMDPEPFTALYDLVSVLTTLRT